MFWFVLVVIITLSKHPRSSRQYDASSRTTFRGGDYHQSGWSLEASVSHEPFFPEDCMQVAHGPINVGLPLRSGADELPDAKRSITVLGSGTYESSRGTAQ